ncbi:ABC transporter substrate-binding protein [Halobacterium wangiae]|uniref:ABC transporter substrate-binding protein n=1 Tax=Halobacterium wangiae TaxID=2902623 RepID=UPI001E458025|nr:ABC transporter substrate-binding protein [Halobacterium wangiae]
MPTRRRQFLKSGLAGTAAALVAGCTTGTTEEETTTTDSGGDTTTTTSGGDPDGDSDEQIRIGFIHPLSGGYSTLGEPQELGGQLAVEQLNANGGIDGKEVVGFHEDSAGDATTAQQKARLLINDRDVDVLTGEAQSSAALAIQQVADEEGIVFGNQAGADPITKSRCNRYTFRYELRTGQVARATAPWAVENLGTKIWFHVADYAYGNAFLDGWKEVLSDYDYEEVNTTKSDLGANDFSSYITQIQNSDADFLALGMAGGDLVKFNQQASSYNLRDAVDIVAGTNDFRSVRLGGGSGVVGTYSGVRYFEGYDNELNRQFVTSFIDAYDQIPANHAESQWTMVHEILAPAIEAAGSTNADDLIAELEGMEFDSPMGGGTMRACDHQAERPVPVAQISEPQDLEVLQGKGTEIPSLDIKQTISGADAIEACDSIDCSL